MVLGDMYFIAISCHTIITTSASCDCVVLLAYQLRISYISILVNSNHVIQALYQSMKIFIYKIIYLVKSKVSTWHKVIKSSCGFFLFYHLFIY